MSDLPETLSGEAWLSGGKTGEEAVNGKEAVKTSAIVISIGFLQLF